MTWDGQPGLNRTVTLTAQVTPQVQADNLTLRWVLPAGVTSAGPITETLGTIVAGETITRQHDITFDRTGTFEVAVDARMENLGGYVTDSSWFDDDYYCYTGNQTGGQNIDFGSMKPTTYDPMFNISDALLDAWRYADQYRTAPSNVRAHYEPGYGDDSSYYDKYGGTAPDGTQVIFGVEGDEAERKEALNMMALAIARERTARDTHRRNPYDPPSSGNCTTNRLPGQASSS